MFVNFIKLALRHIIRQRSYIFINMTGLAIGLACSIFIALFVIHELSYDTFNEKKDQMYRMFLRGKIGATELEGAWTCTPLGPTMVTDLPEVLNMVRLDPWGETVIKYEDRSFVEDGFMLADSTFFEIFTIPLIQGDPDKVLTVPRTLVLTRSAVSKIFGTEDPIGKMLKVGTDTVLYSVVGVMEDVPELAHFEFNMLGSFITNRRANDGIWLSNSYDTYVLLAEGTDTEALQGKIDDMVLKYVGPQVEQMMGINVEQFTESGNHYGYYLQPLLDIHLNHNIDHAHKPPSNKKYIYIFSLIAILILVIAGINYMNLATARSAGRAKEVGIRKVVGSTKRALITQFLFESLVLTLISLAIGIVIVEVLLTRFNNLIQIRLDLDYITWYTIPGLLVIGIIMGFLSGTYPSFFLASFRPAAVLSGTIQRGAKSGILRSILVVFQMTVSIVIIFGTIVVYRQIQFMLNKDLGFKQENLLVLSRVGALGNQQETFMDEVKKLSGVIDGSHSTAVPGHPNNNNGYGMEGQSAEQTYLMQTFWVDDDFINTYGMEVTEGRFFSEDFASDSSACLINQSAKNQFGIEDFSTTTFLRPSIAGDGTFERLEVIGIFKDFHYQSLHDRVYPAILIINDENTMWGYITFRLSPEKMDQTVGRIETLWKEFTDNDPMVYFFMYEDFKNQYQEDRRTGILSLVFSVLAIVIASLGLFGLASFTAEQRTKEIGIRKVNGASASTIVVLLSREVAILVGISTVIAWPIVYFVMRSWLQNFHFRIGLSPIEFIFSLAVVLLVAWLSVSYQAFKVSRTNPAEALRYE
ncbi:MAG: ABC transporter permease [Bacteroidales bacterium]|nr:MAG: ABC transporter permease [Bacteroidales bacterium]